MTRQFKLHFLPRRMYVSGNYQRDLMIVDEWWWKKIIRLHKDITRQYMSTGTSRKNACYLARIDITDLLWAGNQRTTEYKHIAL